MKEKGVNSSRRKFLRFLTWFASLGTLGGITLAHIRFLFPNILYEPPKSYKIGKPEDYQEGVTFMPDKSLFLVRSGKQFKVLSSVCPHLGCTPNWIEEKRQFECPCHGSFFDDTGAVASGPAPGPLPWYDLTQGTDGRLFVNERRIVSFSKALIV